MEQATVERGAWTSKFGFILAAAGSAVGLGNVWRFPYITAQNGGGAFVLLYLLFVVIIGWPIMIAEFAVGRAAERNPVGAFRVLAPKTIWYIVGGLGVACGVGILSYYSVVAGWTVGYFFKMLLGEFSSKMTPDQAAETFRHFAADPVNAVGYTFLFLGLTAIVVMGGVSQGIERSVKLMMPLLFILLLLLIVRALTLEGAGAGIRFYLKPDFSKISGGTVVMALGQALFSLSLGMGTMMTYGSYLNKKESIITASADVCFYDTLIAVMAGFLIFPTLFAMKIDSTGGPGLVFVVLPAIFHKMFLGQLFGAAFFLLLAIAALTSTISLLEVGVAYLVDERKWRRRSAALVLTLIAAIVSLPSALSFGTLPHLNDLWGLGITFLDLMNILVGNYFLTIGAFLLSVFVGYRWGIQALRREVEQGGRRFYGYRVFAFLIRFVCPVAILMIFAYILATKNYF